jgi:C-terminal processing protease CtpA/Prc
MKKMEIGPYSWKAPVVILSGAQVGGLASEDYAGNIGNQLLDRFRCTFDYERRFVYLEPSSRFDKRDRFTMAGVMIARMSDGYRAMQVLPGSPAEEAGLQYQDEVLSVDGKPITSYTQDEVSRIFEEGEPGSRHRIEYRRNGKTGVATVKLKEII